MLHSPDKGDAGTAQIPYLPRYAPEPSPSIIRLAVRNRVVELAKGDK